MSFQTSITTPSGSTPALGGETIVKTTGWVVVVVGALIAVAGVWVRMATLTHTMLFSGGVVLALLGFALVFIGSSASK